MSVDALQEIVGWMYFVKHQSRVFFSSGGCLGLSGSKASLVVVSCYMETSEHDVADKHVSLCAVIEYLFNYHLVS